MGDTEPEYDTDISEDEDSYDIRMNIKWLLRASHSTGLYSIILHDLFPNIDIHQYNYIVINKNLLITI